MGRPLLKLSEWCNKDAGLKIEFLDQECKRENGLIQYLHNPNGMIFIGEPKYLDDQILNTERPVFEEFVLANGHYIRISTVCFHQLKKKFNLFKKAKNEHNLSKKQYHFTSEVSKRIQAIKSANNWKKEEDVIEYLVNVYCNQVTQQKTKVNIETKAIKLKMLKDEIDKNLSEINQLKTEVFQLKQQLQNATGAKEYYQNLCKKYGTEQESSDPIK